jgi:hypothetical protein
MSTKAVELITCDSCGVDASLDHVDVKVSWRGIEYRLDLCDIHFKELQRTIEPLVALGERADVRRLRLSRLRKLHGIKGKTT